MVKVIGLGNVLRIDFDEVLVNAELIYQQMQRAWTVLASIEQHLGYHEQSAYMILELSEILLILEH